MSLQAFIFLFIAIICGVITKIIHKYILKNVEAYPYAFFGNLVSAAISLPLAAINFSFPKSGNAILFLGIASILWAVLAVSAFIAYKKTDLSLREPVSQSRIIWTFILGILLLGETATIFKTIATALIFLGISLLIWHPERKWGRLTDPGILWTLGSALLASIVAIVDKASLGYFNPEVYNFLVYLFPTILLAVFLPKNIEGFKHLLRTKGWIAFAGTIIQTASYYFTLKTFSVMDITLAYPLLQMVTLLTVIGGIIFLKEKEHFRQKILATAVVVIGMILLRIKF
ncbi:MAG: EamA family transporter [Candidatus Pacebacteria bacterium]|nr:EamA family transporter [Candidatus Paceibacterota bacterium]